MNTTRYMLMMAAMLLAACSKQGGQTNTSNVIKIGHVAPITGDQGHLGKDNENGAQLAVEELNAQGVMLAGKKVTFELLKEDDQHDPKQAPIVAQRFVDAQVAGVIGHLNSGTTIPASSGR